MKQEFVQEGMRAYLKIEGDDLENVGDNMFLRNIHNNRNLLFKSIISLMRGDHLCHLQNLISKTTGAMPML